MELISTSEIRISEGASSARVTWIRRHKRCMSVSSSAAMKKLSSTPEPAAKTQERDIMTTVAVVGATGQAASR